MPQNSFVFWPFATWKFTCSLNHFTWHVMQVKEQLLLNSFLSLVSLLIYTLCWNLLLRSDNWFKPILQYAIIMYNVIISSNLLPLYQPSFSDTRYSEYSSGWFSIWKYKEQRSVNVHVVTHRAYLTLAKYNHRKHTAWSPNTCTVTGCVNSYSTFSESLPMDHNVAYIYISNKPVTERRRITITMNYLLHCK